MITAFVAFIVSVICGTFLTLVVRNRALAHGWVDQAKSSRKIHGQPIPRLGGIAIVGAFFAPLCGLFLVDSGVGSNFRSQPSLVWGLLGGGSVIALLGVYDDFRGAGAKLKFAVQFGVAGALFAAGFRIDVLADPFGPPIVLGYLALPFTLLWIVGVINAMNLIDGLDGLAGGVAFFAIATSFILAMVRGDVLMALLMASLGGAVLGFLIFNFNPASIFMGDTGSMFLGFVLAVASVKTCAKSGTAVAILIPIISLGLPIMDTLLAMLRRSALGRPVFSADKEHIHHRVMSRLFLSQRRAVVVLYGVCCLFTMTALALNYANSAQTAMLLLGVGIVVVILMRKLGYLNLRDAASVGEARRRNLHLRGLIRDVSQGVTVASDIQGVWDVLKPLAEIFNTTRLELRIEETQGQSINGVTYEAVRSAGKAFPLKREFELDGSDERPIGKLRFWWSDGRGEIDRDEELAIELLCDAVSATLMRFRNRKSAEAENVVSMRK